MMNLKIATGLIALLMFASAVPLAKSEDKDSKTVRKLTGCLHKGDGANEFVLNAKNGSRWELRSDSVDMTPHVGHTVTITGTAGRAHAKAHEMKEEVKGEMKEHGMAKEEKERGHLEVTKLTHVNDTCKE